MAEKPSLQSVMDRSAGKVNEQKFRQLINLLVSIVGEPLSEHSMGDPILIRRQIVTQLKSEGVSAGTIQALEQCFMGIVRRAAVDGLIAAPPEGPWTTAWQAVLASSTKLRSRIRVLAAWATERNLEPADVGEAGLCEWGRSAACDSETLSKLGILLASSAKPTDRQIMHSGASLTRRLKDKAARGTVRAAYE